MDVHDDDSSFPFPSGKNSMKFLVSSNRCISNVTNRLLLQQHVMNNFKASTQNFNSNYIYKVEEREESEKIIRRGAVLIENNAPSKVTRYFLKNNKGEPQGYVEEKFIQNFKAETSEDEEFNRKNLKSEKITSAPHEENWKMKIDSNQILKSGKNSANFNLNPRRIYRSRERCHAKKFHDSTGCAPLGSSVFDDSKNYTLDFTSSNSTPSERTFDIKNSVSIAERRTNRIKPTKDTILSKKPQRIFCKDPNKRLKNLFTIVKPHESINENLKRDDIDLLNKTKEILMKLIDRELHRIQSDDNATKQVELQLSQVVDGSFSKKLKLQCIGKIENELRLMKRLINS